LLHQLMPFNRQQIKMKKTVLQWYGFSFIQ